MSHWMVGTHYQVPVLVGAWLVGVYALYLQSLVVRRVRASDRDAGYGWLLGGALCVGTGFWAESLLGVVAVQWPIQVGYVRSVVLASWLPAVMISAGSTWMHCQERLSWRVRVLGGLMTSAAMSLLTFINVSAIVIRPEIHWDVRTLFASFVGMTLTCAVGSVLIRRSLVQPLQHGFMLSVSALVVTLFRGSQMLIVMAVGLPMGAVCLSLHGVSGESLGFFLSVSSLITLLLVHLGTVQDERNQTRQQALQQSLKQARDALEEAAQHDAATGLLNRVGFEQALRKTLAGDVQSLAVFRLNLDGFKTLVETFGHDLGDRVVRFLAGRLMGQVREGDVLCRSDTGEFLLVCGGLSDAHGVAQLAQRMGEVIHEPCLVQDHDIALSCSIGIACYPDSTHADQLLSHSQDAMLTARKAGGGVYCFYERGMDRIGVEQIEMQRDLRHAIARGELALHFQPKLRADDNALAGVEALLRWTHPVRGMVSPGVFIPVAERFGLIGELGLWVLDEACRHIRVWHEAGLNIPVAVNLSAHQLRQPDLELRVRDVLKRHRVPARMLILEITESATMDDIEASLRVFDMLADIGVQLSIDDFGTGYSSLSYLRRLPARQLKIDRSFVRDLAASFDAQAIIEAVVRLSHALGLKVVAEGVETEAQARILARLQCDELQGFLFAKPMPEGALLAWLVQRGTTVAPLFRDRHSGRVTQHDADMYGWTEMETAHP
ncbi:MAG: EAL domain-containing protein [Aquabacterium sp.]